MYGLTEGVGSCIMVAYSVLFDGGGAEGVVDRGICAGDGARTAGEDFFAFDLFSCSLSDMAMAS